MICLANRTALRYEAAFGRYYDPATEQFLSVDPLVDETGHPYSYAGSDPVNGDDPSGLLAVDDEGGGGPSELDGPSPGAEGEGVGGGGGGSGGSGWTEVDGGWVNNTTGEVSDINPQTLAENSPSDCSEADHEAEEYREATASETAQSIAQHSIDEGHDIPGTSDDPDERAAWID